MKPDWKDAPEWANWLALSSWGVWYWYEKKPRPIPTLGGWAEDSRARVSSAAVPCPNWHLTLEGKKQDD